jgi:hypothetical protein
MKGTQANEGHTMVVGTRVEFSKIGCPQNVGNPEDVIFLVKPAKHMGGNPIALMLPPKNAAELAHAILAAAGNVAPSDCMVSLDDEIEEQTKN